MEDEDLDAELRAFQGYEFEVDESTSDDAPTKGKPYEIVLSRLNPFTIKHREMTNYEWMQYVSRNLLAFSNTKLCRILHYDLDSQNLFVIIEETHLVSIENIIADKQFSQHPKIANESLDVTTLLNLSALSDHYMYIADSLLGYNIILKFATERTLTLPTSTFLKFISDAQPGAISQFCVDSLSEDLDSQSDIIQNIRSITDCLNRLRVASEAGVVVSLKSVIEASRDIKELRLRIGPLMESAARQRLAFLFGVDWAESLSINNFNDLVVFCGRGLKADTSRINWAKNNLMRGMLSDFSGFDKVDSVEKCLDGQERYVYSWDQVSISERLSYALVGLLF